jgi:ABC-2 type transport system permease protein
VSAPAVRGTARLLALALRRDRLVVALTAVGLAATMLVTALSYRGLYPTEAERAVAARAVSGNAALVAIAGPARGLETLGGFTVWKSGLWAVAALGLASALLAVRHTRGEEERGQTELLLSGAVGRLAPAVAGLALVGVLCVATAGLTVAGMLAAGLEAGGSLAFGAWLVGAGVVFGAVGAVAGQLVPSARGADGVAVAALGASFALRALGDVGDGTLTWLSPLGWGEELRAFAGERWWPLALYASASVALVALAHALLVRRDLGAGILAARGGPPRAAAWLRTPLGFALRLQRGGLVAWTLGMLVAGLGFGAVGRSADDLAQVGGAAQEVIVRGAATGSLRDAFLSTMVVLLALIASAFAIGSTLRPAADETADRTEPLLTTGLSRTAWATSHLVVAVLGTLVLLGATGLGLGIATALTTDDPPSPHAIPDEVLAALAQAPAVWTLAGLALLLFGVTRHAPAFAWSALVACVLVWIVGPILALPDWVLDLSPFQHTPALPAGSADPLTLAGLTALACGLAAIGLVALGRRDLR